MALHRFFAEGPMPGGPHHDPGACVELPLSAGDMHHLRDVLRLSAGEEIILAGEGRAERVRLTEVGERIAGELTGDVAAAWLPRVTLVQGLAKGDKMDDIVRQTTELGVSRVIPFVAERSVVRLDSDKAEARAARWRRVAEEAAKQSQRVGVPLVTPIVRLATLLEMLEGSSVLVCWEDAEDAPGIGAALRTLNPRPESDVAVVIGPEGGLSGYEARSFLTIGGAYVSLGGTILRTETAGVVATALALYERGGLGDRRG